MPAFTLKNSKPGEDFILWNEEMSRTYNQEEYYEKSNFAIIWIEKKRLAAISSLIKNHLEQANLTDPTILEVGCGTGQVLEEIAHKIKTKNLIGIDPLEHWLKKAKEKLNGKAKLMKGFGEDLPFENNSIDYIVCTEVLEHVIDPKVVLMEFNRVLKKEGLIIISIPNEKLINNLKELINSFKLYNKLFPNIQKDNDWHIHDFDLKLLNHYIPDKLEILPPIHFIPHYFTPLRYVIALRKKTAN